MLTAPLVEWWARFLCQLEMDSFVTKLHAFPSRTRGLCSRLERLQRVELFEIIDNVFVFTLRGLRLAAEGCNELELKEIMSQWEFRKRWRGRALIALVVVLHLFLRPQQFINVCLSSTASPSPSRHRSYLSKNNVLIDHH